MSSRHPLVGIVVLLVPLLWAQDVVVVPEGSEIFVRLGGAINQKTVRVEDSFYGVVEVPVVIDDRIVIPAESRLLGYVSHVGKGRRWIGLDFERLILPSGQNVKIEGVLSSTEGEVPVDDEEGDGLPEIPTNLVSAAKMGVDALLDAMDRDGREIARQASLTVRLQRDLRLALPPSQPR